MPFLKKRERQDRLGARASRPRGRCRAITAANANSPMICGESQAYWLPPQDSASSSGTTQSTSVTAPR